MRFGRMSAAEAAAALKDLGAQAALGFPPVQQGTGSGQAANTLKFGWDGSAKLLAQVDGVPLGQIWTDAASSLSKASTGYIKLPSGLIIQWGAGSSTASDFVQSLPVTYPTANVFSIATPAANPGSVIYSAIVDQLGTGSFAIRTRAQNGASTAAVGNVTCYWHSIGF